MKTAIFKGLKIGTITGFISALGYAVVALIIVALFLPIPDPTTIVIFGNRFDSLLSAFIIPSSPFWLLGSTAIGGFTAIGFAIYLYKARPSKKGFITVCILMCITITSPFLLLSIASVIFATFFNGAYHSFINPLIDNLLKIGFPCMIYILAGLFTSNYLYNNAPTENIIPASA